MTTKLVKLQNSVEGQKNPLIVEVLTELSETNQILEQGLTDARQRIAELEQQVNPPFTS